MNLSDSWTHDYRKLNKHDLSSKSGGEKAYEQQVLMSVVLFYWITFKKLPIGLLLFFWCPLLSHEFCWSSIMSIITCKSVWVLPDGAKLFTTLNTTLPRLPLRSQFLMMPPLVSCGCWWGLRGSSTESSFSIVSKQTRRYCCFFGKTTAQPMIY